MYLIGTGMIEIAVRSHYVIDNIGNWVIALAPKLTGIEGSINMKRSVAIGFFDHCKIELK